MDSSFIELIYQKHKNCGKCPSTLLIPEFFTNLLGILFPNFASKPVLDHDEFKQRIDALKFELIQILSRDGTDEEVDAYAQSEAFFNELPNTYQKIQLDIDAMFAGDPAAKTREEVIRSYPGFYAIAAFRVANSLSKIGSASKP